MRPSAVFEEEVRRVARELFPQGNSFGPVILDGRERDSVIVTTDTVHIIEATQDPRRIKAEGDLNKSIDLKRSLQKQYTDHNFKIWFITDKDPTADQVNEADGARKKAKCPVSALSLRAFSNRLINTAGYIAARKNYPFGSIRNPDPDNPNLDVLESSFVPIDLLDLSSKSHYSPRFIAKNQIREGKPLIVIGEYGAGKSMTLRHIYHSLVDRHNRNETVNFPIFINLRDHIGQNDPSSALFDHGSKIGFRDPEQLVRSWRAGFVDLFLDGFDEIVSSRFRANAGGLRTVRRAAMTLVRRFVEENPAQSGLIISGRQNYFSTIDEMLKSFGTNFSKTVVFSLNEFTTEQVKDYLTRLGAKNDEIPDWLPARPLLVGYLATRGILNNPAFSLKDVSRAEGWDYLVEQICQREGGQIEDLGGETDRVREFVDRLATSARMTNSGRGPIPVSELNMIFKQIFPSSPDEAAQQLLLRMAGLTELPSSNSSLAVVSSSTDQDDAREFADNDLADVARAGDVCRFIRFQYDNDLNAIFSDRASLFTMGELGLSVAMHRSRDFSCGQITAALKHAAGSLEAPALTVDLLNIAQQSRCIISKEDNTPNISINAALIPEMTIDGSLDLSGINLQDCVIQTLIFENVAPMMKGPSLKKCLIDNVSGITNRRDVPSYIINDDCGITNIVNEIETNNEVWQQQLSEPVRVLVISLRKLFLQPGGGRKENAFMRGLDEREKVYVQDILALISKHSLAHPQKISGPPVWLANRAKRQEAIEIIQSPQQSLHPLLVEARGI